MIASSPSHVPSAHLPFCSSDLLPLCRSNLAQYLFPGPRALGKSLLTPDNQASSETPPPRREAPRRRRCCGTSAKWPTRRPEPQAFQNRSSPPESRSKWAEDSAIDLPGLPDSRHRRC
eukprot:scaffold1396_cov252-Pinguiococcus_pyrenoidosus.AAC.13